MTNSNFGDNVNTTMFAQRFLMSFRREKRQASRIRKSDAVTEQVRKMLQTADQKLILMVRG